MIFIRTGQILATFGFIAGIMAIGMGIFLGFNLPADDPETFARTQAFYEKRYGATTGGMVNQGVYMMLGSVVLGLLVEIARKS